MRLLSASVGTNVRINSTGSLPPTDFPVTSCFATRRGKKNSNAENKLKNNFFFSSLLTIGLPSVVIKIEADLLASLKAGEIKREKKIKKFRDSYQFLFLIDILIFVVFILIYCLLFRMSGLYCFPVLTK